MFKPIPFKHRRGIIVGYIVYYQTLEKLGIEADLEYHIPDPERTIREIHLTGLELQVNYSLAVAGYTSKGTGPQSSRTVISTGAYSK